MSKWRPSKNCLYVIPDIHGRYKQLKVALKRILPLRKTGGSYDKIVFLGDYIDRDIESHKVLDLLIDLKEEYPDQMIFLKGNHEDLFLHAMFDSNSDNYRVWMANGGEQTLKGYIQYKNIDVYNAYTFDRKRIKDIVPTQHIDFIKTLKYQHETDDHIFVHGGYDPSLSAENQSPEELMWGNGLYEEARRIAHHPEQKELPWKKTIVMGHFWSGPFVYDKFMMLDRSKFKEVVVAEMNSREIVFAKPGNGRVIKDHLDSFIPTKRGVFRRSN